MTNAKELTAKLGGQWLGRYGSAPCPVCQPDRRKSQNALTITEGGAGLLLHCKKTACAFLDILAAAGLRDGSYRPPDTLEFAKRDAERRAAAMQKSARARRLWQEARRVAGTPAEAYLRGRGITCPLPATLRYHGAAGHPTGGNFPALVALVQGGDGGAVHRTYLRGDGAGKAEISPAKAMLGATAGGAVRLTGDGGRLVVAEGIETGLSLASGLLAAPAMIWAALSTSGLRALKLPEKPGRLTIAPDGDTPGRNAAHALAERAAGLGWRVAFLDPGDGLDFNDILAGKAVAA